MVTVKVRSAAVSDLCQKPRNDGFCKATQDASLTLLFIRLDEALDTVVTGAAQCIDKTLVAPMLRNVGEKTGCMNTSDIDGDKRRSD